MRKYYDMEVRKMSNISEMQNKTITSLEVAEMVEKNHNDLLKDIRRYSEQLSLGKIPQSDFFIDGTYKTERGKEYPCYLVTKKGCEFIANKMTGVKGTMFTAKYINRFHDMEEFIVSNKTLIEQGISVVKFIADDLNVNEASRLLMYENYCKDVGMPTGFLPKYEHNSSREMKAPSHLLKENGCELSILKFNSLLVESGYLEERERPSSKGTLKKFKALTSKGLKYGENAVNPHNQKEVQPLYYSDKFMELYNMITR